MKRQYFISLGVTGALLLAGCGSGGQGRKQFVVAFSQANNAEPYRAAQNAFLAKLLAQQPDVKLAISDAQQDNSKQVAPVSYTHLTLPTKRIV